MNQTTHLLQCLLCLQMAVTAIMVDGLTVDGSGLSLCSPCFLAGATVVGAVSVVTMAVAMLLQLLHRQISKEVLTPSLSSVSWTESTVDYVTAFTHRIPLL